MPTLASIQSGNFTAASTWGLVDNASALVSEVATQNVTNSFVSSSGFIPAAGTYLGVAVRVLSTQTVPVGTFTARLSIGGVAIAGTTTTINVSDISNGPNSMGGWVFFKFAAPVVLAAVTTNVDLVCSASGQVTCYRNATTGNWSRILVTNINAAPAATDDLNIIGEYTGPGTSNTITVTMNNTAIINYANINVGGKGVLQFDTAPSTAYNLRLAGTLFVTGQGSLTVGTSLAPIPVSSSAAIRFVNTTNVDFGIQIRGTANVETFGASKITKAYLAVDRFFGATSLTTDIATGWLTADDIAIASTSTAATQTEERSLVANAIGINFDITSGLGFSHSGTAPTRAEIINLSRNVRILGTSATLQTYITNIEGSRATVSFNFTEFRFLGSATGNRRGIQIHTAGIGSYALNGCSLRNFEAASSIGIEISTSVTNTTITDCVFYRINTQAITVSATAQPSVSITNCWGFVNLTAVTLFNLAGFAVFSDILAVSSLGIGIFLTTGQNSNNLTAHSNNSVGIVFTVISQLSTPPIISNTTAWRNSLVNVRFSGCFNVIFDTINVFSVSIANLDFQVGVSCDVHLKNITCDAGISPTAQEGLRFTVNCDKITVTDSFFGVTTPHSIADIRTNFVRNFLGCNLYNCILASTTEVFSMLGISDNSFISSSKHNGISGEFKTFTPLGNITKDYTIFDTTYPGLDASTRLTPSTTIAKISSDKIVAVPNGKRLKITVAVRRSVIGDGEAHNGALPQLIVKKNWAIGLTVDTLLTEATSASDGAFEFISGTTPVATDDGAFTFCVTTNGTAGWINVDSWQVEVI